MKRYVEIAIGLFLLHTVEESVFQFWDTDPFTSAGAALVHLPQLWVYCGLQMLVYTFLLCLRLVPHARFRMWGSVVLAVLLLFEMEHIVLALQLGYVPGLVTGIVLSTYGVIFSTILVNASLKRIKSPLPEELKHNFIRLLSLLALLYSIVSASSFIPTHRSLALSAGPVEGNFATTTALVTEEVLPKDGFQTKIVLGDIIPKMVSAGIIDLLKVEALYKNSGGIPPEELKMLTQSSDAPLVIRASNANWLINVLWPIGLSNKMSINNKSPIAGRDVNNFASTGGWNLGKQDSGGAYFNSYPLISLTLEQQQLVKQIAENAYRPCCNNSTFFQDCNHGSAALALIEIGVAQGLSDDEIYRTLLDFNSFWFQQNYLETALYFKVIRGTDWGAVDPKLALSQEYSSISGWRKNVDAVVSKLPGVMAALLPSAASGGNVCTI